MSAALPFPYAGDPKLFPAVLEALHGVIDPEMALDIVELGLVYGVEVGSGMAKARITMTSAACPVTEHIVDEVTYALGEALGDDVDVQVEVVWDPPWGPERMSSTARAVMGWE